jgi:hypothetical protein
MRSAWQEVEGQAGAFGAEAGAALELEGHLEEIWGSYERPAEQDEG